MRDVSRRTHTLVVGALGWPLLPSGRPAGALRKAHELGVTVVTEAAFLEDIGVKAPDSSARTLSTEEVARASGLDPASVELAGALGLLEPREGLYAFRDLAVARQLATLTRSGVDLPNIMRGLREAQQWMPEESLANLRFGVRGSRLTLIAEGRESAPSGQFERDLGEPADDPDELFDRALEAEEVGELAEAERLYRRVTGLDRQDATALFNLGNILRERGRPAEAEECFRQAAKRDETYAEALYNLADLLERHGNLGGAAATLVAALRAEPGFADAVYNLALLEERRENRQCAHRFWRRYVELDPASEWGVRPGAGSNRMKWECTNAESGDHR